MRIKHRFWITLCTLPCVAAGVAADVAQASPQSDALLPQPVAPLSSQGQASAITRNPALLGAIGRWELDLRGYYGMKEPRLGPVFSAFAGLRPTKNLAMAIGLTRRSESVRKVRGQSTLLMPRSELSLGLSLGNPNRLAVGLSIHTPYSMGHKTRAPDLGAGLVTRWGNYLSFGSALRHRPRYTEPVDQSRRSHTRWSNELAVRPWGRSWLELAGTSHLLTRRSMSVAGDIVRNHWRWGGRISGTYKAFGLDLVAQQRTLDDPFNRSFDRLSPLYEQQEWEWGLQFRLAPGNVELSLASRAQGDELEAMSMGLRIGPGVGSRHSLLSSRRRTLILDLDKVTSEQDLLRVLEAMRVERGRFQAPIVLQGSLSALGWASAMELRTALRAYKDAGGRVFAHLDESSLRTYYLASVAETIYVDPTTTFGLYEPGSRSLYFKDALDRLSIKTEWMHTGPYKTAFERFAQKGPSTPDLEQRGRIYALIQGEVLRAIASDRPQILPEAAPKTAANKAPSPKALRASAQALSKIMGKSPIAAPLAQSLGLADKVAYFDESKEAIASTLGVSSLKTESLTSFVDPESRARPWGRGAYIGVVVVQGSIVSGEGFEVPVLSNRYAGDKTFDAQLDALQDDPDCYGVIVRVNSPGGSAIASDRMWKSVHDFVQGESEGSGQGKPLVISMSDAAASGGYYLSAAAPQIFAQPLTITGSIGVTALHFDLSGLMGRIGISSHAFGEGQARSPYTPFAPWNKTQRENIHRNIEAAYDLFVSKVHKGRSLPIARVKELAGGRVWMGYDAKPRKLVDAWGGYEEARGWIVDRLSAAQKRQDLGLRVMSRDPGLLSSRLAAFSARVRSHKEQQQSQGPAHLLKALMGNVAKDPVAQALLDLVMLPQDASITWSKEAASAQHLGKR